MSRFKTGSADAYHDDKRTEDETWSSAFATIKSVLSGKVAVSDEAIEKCWQAYLRLQQIEYELGQLMVPIGSPAPGVLDAVMGTSPLNRMNRTGCGAWGRRTSISTVRLACCTGGYSA